MKGGDYNLLTSYSCDQCTPTLSPPQKLQLKVRCYCLFLDGAYIVSPALTEYSWNTLVSKVSEDHAGNHYTGVGGGYV